MRLIIVVMLLLALPAVSANIVIQQVLYDPVGTEAGGEAILLYNNGPAADIGNWYVSTETSEKDAVIPENTVVYDYFLIADKNWQAEKDGDDWPVADYEETISLTNHNAGIVLKDSSGSIVDAVGWGESGEIKDSFFEANPADEVAEGKVLLRTKDTGDNFEDFIESEPFFPQKIIVDINVSSESSAKILDDDLLKDGIQIIPIPGKTRKIQIQKQDSDEIMFQGSAVSGLEIPYYLAPGDYEVFINSRPLAFEVMPVKAFKLLTGRVSVNAFAGSAASAEVQVKNTGNVRADIGWHINDLISGSRKISAANIEIGDSEIGVNEQKSINVKISIPKTAGSGNYRSVITAELE